MLIHDLFTFFQGLSWPKAPCLLVLNHSSWFFARIILSVPGISTHWTVGFRVLRVYNCLCTTFCSQDSAITQDRCHAFTFYFLPFYSSKNILERLTQYTNTGVSGTSLICVFYSAFGQNKWSVFMRNPYSWYTCLTTHRLLVGLRHKYPMQMFFRPQSKG